MRGQPRPGHDVRQQPTAAERVRTLAESNASACLSIPGADSEEQVAPFPPPGATWAQTRAVASDGSVVVLVTAGSSAGQAALRTVGSDVPEASAVLEITDVAPVAVPQRIRGRAWIAGWLTAVPADQNLRYARLLDGRLPDRDRGELLVRLEPGEAYTDDLWGRQPVEPDDFARARPDPLCVHEAELLQHLATAHRDQLALLCGALPVSAPDCAGWERMAPVGLDRYGLRLRFWNESGSGYDARFDFATPVRDVTGLRHALHQLLNTASIRRSPGNGGP